MKEAAILSADEDKQRRAGDAGGVERAHAVPETGRDGTQR